VTSSEVGSTANRYEVLAKLAEGGMAEIFLAKGASTVGIERYVVLKRILPERAHDTSFVQMFLDEARLAAQLQHPNIAQVYDVGRLGESFFFTMEYVHGATVRAIIKRAKTEQRPVPIGAVLAIAAAAAGALHHAHGRKGPNGAPLHIVHRDVSPSNLMVSYEGHVKLVDFGVAKAADRLSHTMKGTLKGKIAYLTPEQCNSQPVDRRTDLFALGIVMWELLTGEYLYRRDSDFMSMNAIISEPPRPASSVRGDVPRELDEILLRLLAKDPSARYQTGGEVVDAIESVAARLGASVTPSTLARFMTEWYGERPEPWIELEASQSTTGITVSTDPLQAPNDDASQVDEQLRKVPTLPPTEVDLEVLRAAAASAGLAAPAKKPTMPTVDNKQLARRLSSANGELDIPVAPPRTGLYWLLPVGALLVVIVGLIVTLLSR
jgi:serine/threonine-protein kinase